MNTKASVRALLPVLVLVAGAAITVGLVASKPEPVRTAPVDRGVLVETRRAELSLERFDVSAQGVVIPAREVTLQPQVAGRVIEAHPDLVPGGRVREGDVLLSIDPADYRLAVATRRTRVAEAEAALALEQGRRRVAEREWSLFGDGQGDAEYDPALALREPQIASARAALASARAQLDQALLDLERTRVRAPFNALVRAESVDVGQIVGPQNAVATLAGTDRYWVQVSVQPFALSQIDRSGASATIVFDVGGKPVHRDGQVVRILGDLDPAGQMARVLVAVDDPLGLEADNAPEPLLLGSYVQVDIAGNQVREVVRLPREWLVDGDAVHLYTDGRLEVRPVTIAWRRTDAVLVSAGLAGGERIVVSAIATPVSGMRLRTNEDTAPVTALGSVSE